MENKKILLRIEGTNLSASILDTQDLSTRRGGSLMLLNIIKDIEGINKTIYLEPISTGASVGLFSLEKNHKDAVEEELKNIINKNNEPYQYGTYEYSFLEYSEKNFHKTEYMLTAKNRWKQMQHLSFSAKDTFSEKNITDKQPICKLDEVRPSEEKHRYKKDNVYLSRSVKQRREYGQDKKQSFYEDVLGADDFRDLTYSNFTNDLSELAGDIDDDSYKHLKGKIAVFYVDGNSFGSIGRNCKTPNALQAWDTYIKEQRKNFLQKLITHANDKYENKWRTKKNKIRLETLLWGGDELMFVVPAWCAFGLITCFYECTKNLKYPEKSEETLTHACGLVICHATAHIKRTTSLACILADKGKAHSRNQNTINWLIFESFDHAGSDLDDYLKRQYQGKLLWQDLQLHPKMIQTLEVGLRNIKAELPRGAISRHITQVLNDTAKLNDLTKNNISLISEQGNFKKLWKDIHPENKEWDIDDALNPKLLSSWIKIIEFWDYCN